jgi:hypothetical protein
VITAPAHREESLVPDHLAGDLEADPLEAHRDLGRVHAGVPDVADGEGGDEGEGLGPVDPRVTRQGHVAMAVGPLHVRLFGRPELVVHAVAPGRIERHPIGRIRSEEGWLGAVEQARDRVGIGGVAAQQAMLAQEPQVARLDVDVRFVGDRGTSSGSPGNARRMPFRSARSASIAESAASSVSIAARRASRASFSAVAIAARGSRLARTSRSSFSLSST